jgi:cephalosporin-C deacetylase
VGWFDFPLDKLKTLRSPHPAPKDFDAFWRTTLKEAASFPLEATFVRVDDPIYRLADVYDVTFRGFGGHPIKGWFIEPAGNKVKRPTWVTYLGYGGGRSLPIDHLVPTASGFSHLVMDTRGQGCGWSPGDTADPAGTGPQVNGFFTRGIDSRETYYFRRVFTDAVRAVEAAASHPRVDPARIAVSGGSQGGAIAVAAGGLCGRKVKLVLADVPAACYFRRAVTVANMGGGYGEITNYLKCHRDRVDKVFSVLDYFDGVNFAARIKARTLVSVGLMDDTCPPSTVFASYNGIKAPKAIRVYDYNMHEGGGVFQQVEKLRFAAKWL